MSYEVLYLVILLYRNIYWSNLKDAIVNYTMNMKDCPWSYIHLLWAKIMNTCDYIYGIDAYEVW